MCALQASAWCLCPKSQHVPPGSRLNKANRHRRMPTTSPTVALRPHDTALPAPTTIPAATFDDAVAGGGAAAAP
jgi:hypothetical protein